MKDFTITVDGLENTFKNGICSKIVPALSTEGGMEIICTGERKGIEELRKIAKDLQLEVRPPRQGSKGNFNWITIDNIRFTRNYPAIVVSFPALCTDPKLTTMPCTLQRWTHADLQVMIRNQWLAF